ncbi:uncharacterized protein [Mytilus edulis]|uniref:uncharacterized protein isoform X2 n=1 Tax=Mytilus edulis TaxID=6550 RepID=UPI0039EE4C83
MMFYIIWMLSASLSTVYSQLQVNNIWSAHTYWNDRYSLGYTATETDYGMWSYQPSTKSNGYMDVTTGVQSCSGCGCTELRDDGILKSCSGSVTVAHYSFPNISSETFAVSTSAIDIRHCGAFAIVGQTFVNLTALTKLTIENSGITTMPDLGNTQITELNLMFNSIEIKTNFKGSLPASITHVALTGNKIYWIPNGFLNGPNLRSVSLGGNSFINFPVLGFGSMPSLVYFGIENNQLRRLSVQHMNNFKESPQLHLNLSYNVLDYIQPYAFSGIPNIKVLEIHQNSLASIAKGVFENLTTLIHLDLHANNLETLNKEAFKDLEYLEELRLHSQKTPMTTLIFNSMINVGKSLKYLFISSNALTHIPHQVFMENSYDNIVQLHLDNNAITNVTELDANGYGATLQSTYNEKKVHLDPFSTMSNLNILYLHGNAITHITSTDYCRLTSLTELYLTDNELTEDNMDVDSFTCVITLARLHLGTNKLQYVPAALTNSTRLPSINTLYVTNNKLTFIEAGTFSDLSTMRVLYLHSNKIISIEDNAFPDMIRLIALQSNDFRFIHENQFSNLSNMYRLNLANNDIDYLPDNVFSGCTSLTQLVLNGNKIKQIKKMHLENCPLSTQLYLQNNELGWIEDGALDHITSISYLYLHNNRLYSLPMGGDFNDMTVTYFYLYNNRISAILNGTFKNFVVSLTSLDLSNNRIATIEGNAFTDVTVSYVYSSLKLTNNKIKDIQPYAFNNVNAPSIQFDGDTMGVIPSYAFNDITASTLNLYNIGITGIEENAFNNFNVGLLYLYGNSISSLDGSIFAGTSSVTYLYLNKNNIAYIKANVFDSVTVTYLYLNENSLSIYPIALSQITPREIYLEDNEITGIPDGSLAGQTNLQIFSMYNNKLTEITATTFTSATNLQTLLLQNNEIQYIEEGSFNGLDKLETLDLSSNQLSYFPAISMETLTSLNLGGNMIETLGGFPVNNSIVVNLTGNSLGCECSTAYSLYYVKDTVTGGTCASPSALAGVTFEAGLVNSTSFKYFDTLNDTKKFQCSAENIVGTAVSSTEMKIQWNRPSSLYAVFDTNDTIEAVGANVATWNYIVTCTSTTAATLTKTETVTVTIPSTSHSASVTFKDTDGLLPLNSYDCVIQLEVNGYTSAKSIPETVYIRQTQSNTSVANSLPVSVYDFTISNDDFGTAASMTPSNPYHVISPTGSWPAISTDPTSDTFSDWFRDTTANIKLDREIVLTVDSSSGSDVHNYYSDSYFLADDSGYGAEGQTDCGGILHNFFYTSAIRTGLKFSGSEKITVGGGEELWVFLNKVLVIEIIANRASASVACQTVDLSAAAATGGGTLTLEEGTIVGGVCTGLTPLASTVSLDLEVDDSYLFEIFHVERAGCSSQLLLHFDSVYLTNHVGDTEPMHYKYTAAENLHVNGLVGEFTLWDIFTSGPPYTIELYKGNEARHFAFKDDTTTNQNAATTIAPPTYNYVTVTGTSLQYIACTSNTQTPEPNNAAMETFTITTTQALVTLATELNFEVAESYNLVFRVIDTNAAQTGSLVVKVKITDVNDNCPVMNVTSDLYFTTERPLLQLDPLFIIGATDADSGTNGQFQYHVSGVLLEEPSLDYSEALAIREQVYNGTTEVTVEVAVIDLGNPPHGSVFNVTVNLSNTCLIDELFDRTNITFMINTTDSDGEFYLRIPGYWIVDFQCDEIIGISSGIVRDELITASSSRDEYSKPARGRLNLTHLDDTVTAFSGAWVAGTNDADQYIQVDMEDPYKFTKLYLQGQSDEANWVTAFKLYYTDDDAGNWTLYQSTSGEFIFLGNIDSTSTAELTLDPPILSRYIKINPQNWTGAIALRMEFAGCTQAEQFHWDFTCERCYTSFYCLGDGANHTCGRCEDSGTCDRSPTEHSFGAAGECSPCPIGWICQDGVASRCEDYHYVNCTDVSCPSVCAACDPGYACRGGQSYICDVGTFSDGSTEFCEMCSEGTYQDQQGQTGCKNCAAGYFSATSKDRCDPCDVGSYSLGDGSGGCVGCAGEAECPCMGNQTCFIAGEYSTTCINKGSGSHECLTCPPGFTGDGNTCADIDECAFNPCWDPAACINTVPGYQCSACPYGYTGSNEDALSQTVHLRVFESCNQVVSALPQQNCTDIDECAAGTHICDVNSECINTIGSYRCGYCNEGYEGVSTHFCYSTNYCDTGQHDCHTSATCVYLRPTEYRCECPVGYAGNGKQCGLDSDLDGHPDITIACTDWGCYMDNCRTIPNCGQEDVDNDNMGDDCDFDKDNDGLIDSIDNCPYFRSFDSTDTDGDSVGDPCDNCPSVSNSDQKDNDDDSIGDVCDSDDDNDGVADASDNCQFVANPGQEDSDGDNHGDACDNCVNVFNNPQTDTDENKVGDACDTVGGTNKDKDGDSILDINDNCQEVPNGDQSDIDGDGTGDVCDTDFDGDGVIDTEDNCPYRSNPLQTDIDGNKVGDDCAVDADGDGMNDSNDTCPHNPNIFETSFNSYFTVDFYPTHSSTDPVWWVKAAGREIYQTAATGKPAALIGEQSYGSIEYSGTVYVRSTEDDNYVGFIFGYTNNRKFYLVSWRPNNYNFDNTTYKGGIKGVHISAINSDSGPSQSLAEALWLDTSTDNELTVLWHDPNLVAWSNFTSYKWFLTHNTELGKIRLKIYDINSLLIDSGDIYDTSITGGRVGVFQFGQQMSLWSDLKVKCIDRENMAIYFSGSSDYVSLTNIGDLNIYHSFTIDIWVMVETGYPTTEMPILCTENHTICLWMENGIVNGQYINSTVQAASAVTADQWTSVVLIYDETDCALKLYIDGTLSSQTTDIKPVDLSQYSSTSDTFLYLGTDGSNYYQGYIDEFQFFNIAILETEVLEHIELPLVNEYPKYHNYGQLYLKFDQTNGTSSLTNTGLLSLTAQVHGSAVFKESMQDYNRFQLTYPDN